MINFNTIKNSLVLLLFLMSAPLVSQELNCSIVVNAQQTGNQNEQVFKTLENQLTEFVNNTVWTDKKTAPQERIDCSMVISVSEQDGDSFKATIQVQASRPVYGSTFSTPIYNVNDKDFNFKYLEFQNLNYSPNQYESNLISVISFHVYMTLGLDADSFAPNGGDPYFKQAQTIVGYSQSGNYAGWKLQDGLQTRYILVDNLLSPAFKGFRTAFYDYHRNGLDLMHDDAKQGKATVAQAVESLQAVNSKRPNSYVFRTFFDAKGDEIESMFSSGPSVKISGLVGALQKIAPMHSSKWRNIKY